MVSELGPKYFSRDYFFGSRNSNYIDYRDLDNDRWWEDVLRVVDHYQLSGRMLDLGCAFGYLLKRTEPSFEKVVGLDISDFALRTGRDFAPHESRYSQNFVQALAEELPFPNESFDFITAFDILEHTPSFEESLHWMRAKLKPQGVLMAVLPLKDTLGGRVFGWFDKDRSHVSIPTQQELFQMVHDVGFETLEWSYSFAFALGPIVVKSSRINSGVQLVLRKPASLEKV